LVPCDPHKGLIKDIKLKQGKVLIDSSEPKRVPTEVGADALIKLYGWIRAPGKRVSG